MSCCRPASVILYGDNITVSSTAIAILGADPSRKRVVLVPEAGATIRIGGDNTVTPTTNGFLLGATL